MEVEQAKQIANKAIDELSQALERGHSETLKNYLAAMARFRQYSWHNVAMIFSQRPDATRVAGFHTWKQLRRSVKRGAKGIMILAPILLRKSNEEVADEEQNRTALGFRIVYVSRAETEQKSCTYMLSGIAWGWFAHRRFRSLDHVRVSLATPGTAGRRAATRWRSV